MKCRCARNAIWAAAMLALFGTEIKLQQLMGFRPSTLQASKPFHQGGEAPADGCATGQTCAVPRFKLANPRF